MGVHNEYKNLTLRSTNTDLGYFKYVNFFPVGNSKTLMTQVRCLIIQQGFLDASTLLSHHMLLTYVN